METIGNPVPGDRVLATLCSNVVRSAVYKGTGPGPVDPDREGVLLDIAGNGQVIEWVDKEYVRKLEVTVSRGDRQ